MLPTKWCASLYAYDNCEMFTVNNRDVSSNLIARNGVSFDFVHKHNSDVLTAFFDCLNSSGTGNRYT